MEPTDVSLLIPTPDTIPAPWQVFEVLDIVTFVIHLLFMNVVVGGCIIAFFSGFKKANQALTDSLHGVLVNKIPSTLALAVTFGVAPLLFIQVLYGQFIYSSSIIMAVYWILVIPLLILAYYGVYIHAVKYNTARLISTATLVLSTVILVIIMMIFVNNMTLMVQPEKWAGYFVHRSGTILNTADPTFFPRFLHFLTAAIAVAGLFAALTWYVRGKKDPSDAALVELAAEKTKNGLNIFAIATSVQVVIGIWFLVALPREIMLGLMVGNRLYTVFLLAGIAAGVAVMVTAFLGKPVATGVLLVATVVFMAINRANLRSLYLEKFFDPASLKLSPQYSLLTLFLLIFVIGLGAVAYMLKSAFKPGTSEGGAG